MQRTLTIDTDNPRIIEALEAIARIPGASLTRPSTTSLGDEFWATHDLAWDDNDQVCGRRCP